MNLTLPVDGFRLAYERVGRGPAVVLLHGWENRWPGSVATETRRSPSAAIPGASDRGSTIVPASVSNAYRCVPCQPMAAWIIRCSWSSGVFDGAAMRRHTGGWI